MDCYKQALKCSICEYDFTFAKGIKEFDFIHHNKKHENTKPFDKKAICEACKYGIWKDNLKSDNRVKA